MIRAVIINILLSIVLLLSGFFSRIIYSHLIAKEDLSFFYIFLDFTMMVGLLTAGLKDSTIRNYRVLKSKLWEYFLPIGGIAFVLQATILIIFLIRYKVCMSLSLLFIVYFLFIQARTMIGIVSLATGRYGLINLDTAVAFFNNILGIIFMLFFTKRVEMILCGGIISSMIGTVFLMRLLGLSLVKIARFGLSYGLRALKNIKQVAFYLKHSFTASVEYVFSSASNYLSGILLLSIVSLTDLGDFNVVAKPVVFALIAVFVFPLGRFTLPEFSKLLFSRRGLIGKRSVIFSICYAGTLFLVPLILNLGGSQLVCLVFPPKYINAYRYINILAWIIPVSALSLLIRNLLKAQGNFVYSLHMRMLAGVSFLCFVFIFRKLAITGVCLSIIFSEALSFLLGVFFIRHNIWTYLKRSLGGNKLLSKGK